MFSQEYLEAYRRIRAPDSLRNRIQSDCAAPHSSIGSKKSPYLKYVSTWGAIAAVLLLVINLSVVGFSGDPNADIFYGGTDLFQEPVVANTLSPAPRQQSSYRVVSLSLVLDGAATLEASTGVLSFTEDDDVDTASGGQRIHLQDDAYLLWLLPEGTGPQTLTLVSGFHKTVYVFSIDHTGEITFTRK